MGIAGVGLGRQSGRLELNPVGRGRAGLLGPTEEPCQVQHCFLLSLLVLGNVFSRCSQRVAGEDSVLVHVSRTYLGNLCFRSLRNEIPAVRINTFTTENCL